MKELIEFEESTGNIFSDLGFPDSEELQMRGMIGFHVIEILKTKNLKQSEISKLLNVKQAEVSHLLNGHFSRFSVDKLLSFLKDMDQKVMIEISPHKRGEFYQQVEISV